MGRLTDNDKQFGPLTWGKSDYKPLRLVYSSGGGDEGDDFNSITAYAFGWVARLKLPKMLTPWRRKVQAKYWDAATIQRMGRDWYYEEYPRDFGFSLHEGFLQLFLGAQTMDSETTRDWCTHLPWTQWRFHRFSYYGLDGMHLRSWIEPRSGRSRRYDTYEEQQAFELSVPKGVFEIEDYDGERIQTTTHIEEREWTFGEGWFQWLRFFCRNKVVRMLSINFNKQVGADKGSWKGGVMGHGIEMQPGELHEAAFKRYCAQEFRGKQHNYRVKFLGRVA